MGENRGDRRLGGGPRHRVHAVLFRLELPDDVAGQLLRGAGSRLFRAAEARPGAPRAPRLPHGAQSRQGAGVRCLRVHGLELRRDGLRPLPGVDQTAPARDVVSGNRRGERPAPGLVRPPGKPAQVQGAVSPLHRRAVSGTVLMSGSPRWIFLALTLPTVASAQTGAPGLDPQRPIRQYLHDIWTIDQGLPQNGILAIAQGRDGYLWLGTEAGLVRFDGVTFTTFTTANTSALQDNYISAVMVDSSDDVLVGSWVGGVSRLAGGAGTSAAIPGAEESFVNAVFRDRAGRLWVARTGGLALLRDGAFRPAAGAAGSVFSLDEDSSGLLLAGTHDGLVTWQGDRFVPWQPRGGRITGSVWTVYHDRADGWWFGTPDALYYSHGERLERFDAAAGLPAGGVTSILQSRNGQLWVGTDGGGLTRLVNRRFQRFAVQDGR